MPIDVSSPLGALIWIGIVAVIALVAFMLILPKMGLPQPAYMVAAIIVGVILLVMLLAPFVPAGLLT